MKASAAIASAALLGILVAVSGCGKCSEGGSIAKRAGEKVEDALKIKVSIEKKNQVKIDLGETAKGLGLSMNVSKALPPEDKTGGVLTVYLLSGPEKSASGQLVAKAMDKDGKEIGRSSIDIDLARDDARYFNFQLPAEMDTRSVESYLIDIKR